MADFPPVGVPLPSFDYSDDIEYEVDVSEYDDLSEQRALLSSTPKQYFRLMWNALSKTKMDSVWDFYITKNGSFTSFTYSNPNATPSETDPVIVRFAEKMTRRQFELNILSIGILLKRVSA